MEQFIDLSSERRHGRGALPSAFSFSATVPESLRDSVMMALSCYVAFPDAERPQFFFSHKARLLTSCACLLVLPDGRTTRTLTLTRTRTRISDLGSRIGTTRKPKEG